MFRLPLLAAPPRNTQSLMRPMATLLGTLLATAAPQGLLAAENSPQAAAATEGTDLATVPVAELASFKGKVHVLRSGERLSAQKAMRLYPSDQLVTGPNSAAKVVFADGSSFMAFQEGSVEIESYWTSANGPKTTLNSMLNLVRGKARFFFKPREGGLEASVRTTNAIMGVRGTLFFVDNSQEKQTSLVVLSGQVAVHNPTRPREEVLVRPNEATVVSQEKPPEKPFLASADVVKKFETLVQTLPAPEPDGTAPESLTLPPPVIPGEQGRLRERPPASGGQPVVRQIVTPQYMVLPIGSVLVTKAGIACDRKSMDRLRLAAQTFAPETVVLGRELAQCPVIASEALFWLGFHHIGQGEIARAVEAARFAREEKIPLDVRTERERLIQNALEGNYEELGKLVRAQNPLYAKDGEGLLVLARAQARTGRFAEARATYDEYLALPKLGDDLGVEIEKGYVLLLETRHEEAFAHFHKLWPTAKGTPSEPEIARGLELAQAHKLRPAGSESDRFELAVSRQGSDDGQKPELFELGWESQSGSVQLGAGRLESDKDPLGRFDADLWSLQAARTFRLSTGTSLSGALGYFQAGDQGILTFKASGHYVFGSGLGLGASFSQEPALRSLPRSLMGKPRHRLQLLGTWGEATPTLPLAAYTFVSESFEPEKQSCMSHTLLGRLPIHRGEDPLDFIRIRGKLSNESCALDTPALSSPKQLFAGTAGFELGWKLLAWLTFEGEGDSGLIFRETRTLPSRVPLSASKRRDAVARESTYGLALKARFLLNPNWDASLEGGANAASDSHSNPTWGDWMARAGVRWFYARN